MWLLLLLVPAVFGASPSITELEEELSFNTKTQLTEIKPKDDMNSDTSRLTRYGVWQITDGHKYRFKLFPAEHCFRTVLCPVATPTDICNDDTLVLMPNLHRRGHTEFEGQTQKINRDDTTKDLKGSTIKSDRFVMYKHPDQQLIWHLEETFGDTTDKKSTKTTDLITFPNEAMYLRIETPSYYCRLQIVADSNYDLNTHYVKYQIGSNSKLYQEEGRYDAGQERTLVGPFSDVLIDRDWIPKFQKDIKDRTGKCPSTFEREGFVDWTTASGTHLRYTVVPKGCTEKTVNSIQIELDSSAPCRGFTLCFSDTELGDKWCNTPSKTVEIFPLNGLIFTTNSNKARALAVHPDRINKMIIYFEDDGKIEIGYDMLNEIYPGARERMTITNSPINFKSKFYVDLYRHDTCRVRLNTNRNKEYTDKVPSCAGVTRCNVINH